MERELDPSNSDTKRVVSQASLMAYGTKIDGCSLQKGEGVTVFTAICIVASFNANTLKMKPMLQRGAEWSLGQFGTTF